MAIACSWDVEAPAAATTSATCRTAAIARPCNCSSAARDAAGRSPAGIATQADVSRRQFVTAVSTVNWLWSVRRTVMLKFGSSEIISRCIPAQFIPNCGGRTH